jgi:predicted transcriptional regulator
MAKLHKQVITARITEVWRLRARGASQERIGEILGLSQGTVCRILQRIEDYMLEKMAESWQGKKVSQNAQLEHAADEAFQAWHSSKTPRKRAASRVTSEGGDGPGGTDEVRTTEVIERDGDTGYLYCAMTALRDIRRLWGLDVAEAQQDPASSLADLANKFYGRRDAYLERTAEEATPGDPPGPVGPDAGGDGGVPDRPQPVQ